MERNPEIPQPNTTIAPEQHEIKEAKFIFAMDSRPSDAHKSRNEDAIFMNEERKEFGLFDGVTGKGGGDIASQKAKEFISDALQKLPEGITPEWIAFHFKRILHESSKLIRDLGKKSKKFKEANIATTASIVKIWQGSAGEKQAIIGNVGDSRVYLLRASGKFEQITLDDGQVRWNEPNEARAREFQKIVNNLEDPYKLDPRDPMTYLYTMLFEQAHRIIQTIGDDNIKPRIHNVSVSTGDRIIVTSDGVHDNLTENAIEHAPGFSMEEILRRTKTPQDTVQQLLDAAQKRSRDLTHPRAKPDDMSAIVVDV